MANNYSIPLASCYTYMNSDSCNKIDMQEFDTARSMMESTCLRAGYAHVLGFNEVGDGGEAVYTIDSAVSDVNNYDKLKCVSLRAVLTPVDGYVPMEAFAYNSLDDAFDAALKYCAGIIATGEMPPTILMSNSFSTTRNYTLTLGTKLCATRPINITASTGFTGALITIVNSDVVDPVTFIQRTTTKMGPINVGAQIGLASETDHIGNAAYNATAIFVTNDPPSEGSQYGTSVFTINNFMIHGFNKGIYFDTTNVYIVTVDDCYIEENYYDVYSGPNRAVNTGEKMLFTNCVLGASSVGLHDDAGNLWKFIGCSLDYCNVLFESNAYMSVACEGCHIEEFNRYNTGTFARLTGDVTNQQCSTISVIDSNVVWSKPFNVTAPTGSNKYITHLAIWFERCTFNCTGSADARVVANSPYVWVSIEKGSNQVPLPNSGMMMTWANPVSNSSLTGIADSYVCNNYQFIAHNSTVTYVAAPEPHFHVVMNNSSAYVRFPCSVGVIASVGSGLTFGKSNYWPVRDVDYFQQGFLSQPMSDGKFLITDASRTGNHSEVFPFKFLVAHGGGVANNTFDLYCIA